MLVRLTQLAIVILGPRRAAWVPEAQSLLVFGERGLVLAGCLGT